ncbi:MerR family transcriptional regulator [Vagococcus vulneris]|uniref:MerR family transcriptional regulator n=1 Tax=Vagococcus vulneris TaxID=1977869 RepID=A0A429ZZP9_9ENTE|nr:MerR family transcriptional regulator [Vagococcus vulneris]RST99504.1 MerR family transcriptional regulator [Vagococcus vulneris]
MADKEFRRNMSVFPIGSVMTLTDLTARQIRYYEQQGLITPIRNAGNNRLFSLNDIDSLLEVKDMLEAGFTLKEIGEEFDAVKKKQDAVSEEKIRIALYNDLMRESGLSQLKQF